jgi:uncharacterized membrane protein
MNGTNQILWAMTAMASLGVTVWRQTADRLFLLFAAAFGLLAINYLLLVALDPRVESRHWVYLLRLAAFGLIIYAIVDKNRSAKT